MSGRAISYQKRGCKGGMIIFCVYSNSTLNGQIRSKGVLNLPVRGTVYVYIGSPLTVASYQLLSKQHW